MFTSIAATFAPLPLPFFTTNWYVPGVAVTDPGRTATTCVWDALNSTSGASLIVTTGG
jgi:hypothetical protein